MGLVLPVQVAAKAEPPSMEKVIAPVGAEPVPVHASDRLSAEVLG
jgi:hypothetical protein